MTEAISQSYTQYTQFGEMLRVARQKAGMTLRDMENCSPFTYSHLCRMERGARRPPRRWAVITLAEALKINPDELLRAAGYASVTDDDLPTMVLFGGATPEEKTLIERANASSIYVSAMTTPAFWALPPERRRHAFRHLDGLLDTHEEVSRLLEVED